MSVDEVPGRLDWDPVLRRHDAALSAGLWQPDEYFLEFEGQDRWDQWECGSQRVSNNLCPIVLS